jgi:hypothetical protein
VRIRSALIATAAVLLGACTPTTTGAPDPTPDAARATTVVTVGTPATTVAPAPVAPRTCTVPDVVGMVHQDAQDTMQAAGLYNLREQDSTGQGRVLVLDRNWTTTAQSVAAGQVVDCKTEILLSAKKIGE